VSATTPLFSPQQLRRSSANEQFPYYCKPGGVTVIYVNVGPGWVKTNGISYLGAVQQNADVKFITEQDGTGQILAKFNGAILKCDGIFSRKRKTCTIPKALRPWSGVITVKIGRHPSTRFLMSGTPVCLNPGLQGYNCDQDINECVVHKDKQLCAWKDGCVNTYGGYKCKCPPGYKVSPQDFRLCVPGKVRIWETITRFSFKKHHVVYYRFITVTSLIHKVIPLKLFLDILPSFPATNIITCDPWMFSWRMKIRVRPLGLSRE